MHAPLRIPDNFVKLLWQRLQAVVHSLGVAVVLCMTLGCVDARLSLAEEENGAEIVAVLVHSTRPVQALHQQPGERVATARSHTNVGRPVQTMTQVEHAFDDGHRLANGLSAPLLA